MLDRRITPRLLKVCQTNLVNLCRLPQDWSMHNETNGVQVGTYLSCLHRQRNSVRKDLLTIQSMLYLSSS